MQKTDYEFCCRHGHRTELFCWERFCSLPAGMCEEDSCQYSQDKHVNCSIQTVINNLINSFSKKTTKFPKAADQVILPTLDKMIEDLIILRRQYIQTGRDSFKVIDHKNDLIKLLNKGPQCKARILHNFRGLKKQQEQQQNRDIEKLKQMTNNIIKLHQKNISCFKDLWEKQQRPKFNFEQTGCKMAGLQLLKNGKSIRKAYFNDYQLGPILPPLLNQNSTTIKLKIVKLKSTIAFGIIDKNSIRKNIKNFERSQYFISNKVDKFWSHVQKYGQSYNLKINQGDIVEMTFNKQQRQLKIVNLTNLSHHKLKQIPIENKLWCFGAFSFTDNDEIQIIQ